MDITPENVFGGSPAFLRAVMAWIIGKIVPLYKIRKSKYHLQKSPPLQILSHMNFIYILTFYLF
jgi:hypothetical protein